MYCTGCGTKLEDQVNVCPNCGKLVQTEALKSETVMTETVRTETTSAGKKKIKKLPIILGAVLAIAVVAVIVFWGGISNLFAKTFMSAGDYYLKMEKQNIHSNVSMLNAENVSAVPHEKGGFSGQISLEAGEGLHEIYQLAALSEQLGWLKQIGLEFGAQYSQDELNTFALLVELNKTDIIQANVALDMENNALYAGVPQLLAKQIKLIFKNDELSSLLDEMKAAYSGEGVQMPELTAKELESVLVKYIEIVVKNLDDIQKESAELSVGESTQKCTLITLSMDGEALKKVATAILTEAKSDTVIKEILAVMAEQYGEDPEVSYQEYTKEIDRLLAEIAETDAAEIDSELGGPIVLKNWIDGSGQFVGRELEGMGSVLKIASLEKGNDYAAELSVKNAGFRVLDVYGSGTKNSRNVINAEYVIEVQGEEVALLEVKNLRSDAYMEKGELRGEFYLSPGDDLDLSLFLGSGVPDFYLSMLEQLTLGLTVDVNSEKAEMKLILLNDEITYLTLSVNVRDTGYGAPELPADEECLVVATDDQLALQQVLMGISLDQLMENLKTAGVPEELVNALFASLIYGGY